MKRLLHISLIAISVVVFSACAKDFGYIIGLDTDAPISLTLYGSRYEWEGEEFTSDGGVFTDRNHPEIVIGDDGGFKFDLRRGLESESGKAATLYFYLDNFNSDFEIDKVYSLTLLGKGRACVDFQERGATTTLPSGTTVTDIITLCYRAVDGYIIFTNREEYGEDYLLSGEFEFTGRTTDGDELEVRKGKFTDCRVCFATEAGCPK